jgi:YndJ-like protein
VRKLPRFSVALRVALAGLLAWVFLVMAYGRTLGPISSILMVAPLVVVPLGLGATRPTAMWVCVASVPAAASLVIRAQNDSRNTIAVVLASCWALVTTTLAAQVGLRWLIKPTQPRFAPSYVLHVAALVELCVASIWLVAACLRIELLGFSKPIVLLTAVHFHFAGFGACTVAVIRMKRAQSDAQRLWAARIAVVILGASPLVAIGHLTIGAIELLGGLLLTVGIWSAAAIGWKQASGQTKVIRVLMIMAALAPVIPMLFAIQYGLTRVTDLNQIPFNTIALIHGGLNAFGFLGANLLAENLLQRNSNVATPLLQTFGIEMAWVDATPDARRVSKGR